MVKKLLFILILLSPGYLLLTAQKNPVQISGVVLSNDSVPQTMPYVHAQIKKRGVVLSSNAQGFFSLAAVPGDTILFTNVGFKPEILVLADTLSQMQYLAKVIMKRDTTVLNVVTLYPWPTPERFKDAFLSAQINTTENDIALKNLAIQELKYRAALMGYGAEEIQDFVIAANSASIANYGYYQGYADGGSAILGSLTNPFSWMQFFDALKRGDYRKR